MGRTRALRNVKEVELEDIPKLTKCGLVTAFKCVESVKMENVSKLGDLKALKEELERKKVEEERKKRERERKKQQEEERKKQQEEKRKEEEERRRRERERKREEEERRRKEAEEAAKRRVVISCKRDWDCIDKHVRVIEVSDRCCDEEGLKELDLSGFVNLRELKVGNECFEYVKKVYICGLRELESVIIGSRSFRRDNDSKGGSFYLKNCPKLRELRITGVRSFEDFSVCEIESVDALEVIEMGDVNEESFNFYHASLELKSILIQNE